MKTIKQESTVFIDCDDTLVMWPTKEMSKTFAIPIKNPHDNKIDCLLRHEGHIKVLKDRKARGSFIVVWSSGGFAWAEAVVKALGLEDYVDLCMTKPHMYIDDKKAEQIMGEHLYIPYGSGYGES
jgi:FMN phosphatase YigB (HAD superfamily)